MTFDEILKNHDHTQHKALVDWLSNWSYLAIALRDNSFSEDELLSLIKYELCGNCRMQILLRLKTRWNTLRTKREKAELQKERESYVRERRRE